MAPMFVTSSLEGARTGAPPAEVKSSHLTAPFAEFGSAEHIEPPLPRRWQTTSKRFTRSTTENSDSRKWNPGLTPENVQFPPVRETESTTENREPPPAR